MHPILMMKKNQLRKFHVDIKKKRPLKVFDKKYQVFFVSYSKIVITFLAVARPNVSSIF